MPSLMTSRAVARRASKPFCANPLHTMSRSVTMPISLSFSPIGMEPTSCWRISLAISMMGVSGPTQSTPLCITSLTFMAEPPLLLVVCILNAARSPVPCLLLYNGLVHVARGQRFALNLGEQLLGGADIGDTRRLFHVEHRDHAVIDEHGVAH